MKQKTIIIITGILLSVTCCAQNQYFQRYDDSILLKKDNDALIDDFEVMIKQVSPTFSFNGLSTEIPDRFMPGMYLHRTNKIYHITWQTGWPPMQNFLTKITGTTDSAQLMGMLFFHGFYFPHEVGHALQYHTQMVPDNKYDEEYEANVMAVLYWRSKGRYQELQQCLTLARNVLAHLKNPVPENEDQKTYITQHYDELLKDPFQYGYIQFSQIAQILEDTTLPDFKTYVKRYFDK
ncbi:hypothetical protein [Niabella digestorum]|jgi:hypothetical protein|uniref:Zinc-dependent peptidase n=1 Tax=Niabella digestorum TaxID=3117701 RepID=A0ABU7RCP7_9BACT